MDQYDVSAERWARNMRAAQPLIRRRQSEQHAVMVANRARAKERPCGIKGCKRAGGKRGLCVAHWQLVPLSDRLELSIACYEAQFETAAKFYRRFVRQVNALVKEGVAPAAC